MEWDNKIKLVGFLEDKKYEEAVDLMRKESDWDTQCVDMFILGFNITYCHLCKPIEERLKTYDVSELDWKASVRLNLLLGLMEDKV